MTDGEIQLLFEYIGLLEAELKDSNPEKFHQLVQNREGLVLLLQKQRGLIETLRTAHQVDLEQIDRLQAELAAQQSVPKVQKAGQR